MPAARTAIIIGGGPAGLTAALELLRRTDLRPIIIEQDTQLGGISRTVVYNGNRMDIGGHRFFTKSDRVMQWWLDLMPLQHGFEDAFDISYQGKKRTIHAAANGPKPDEADRVMLVRQRKSRIYHRRKLFDYPLTLNLRTIKLMGVGRMMMGGFSYMRSAMMPIKPEKSLEDFLINRFGRYLYLTFFKSYTEKVWGVACDQISAEWGAQRIKGLSIRKALAHALGKLFSKRGDLAQKQTETSLIERFMYPKYGPGQMWEIAGEEVKKLGGEIRMKTRVTGLRTEGDRVVGVTVQHRDTGETEELTGDVVFSTMPIRYLARALGDAFPPEGHAIAEQLQYRDFVTVGLLVDRLKLTERGGETSKLISDNWIYIQEPDVQIGRLQIFNNWSPYLVADASKVWLGLEYFCNRHDALWSQSDAQWIELGARELEKIGIIEPGVVRDATVVRVPQTYPAYFGVYERFEELRPMFDRFENLYLVGRNGMHKYNNQDHSMLAAMTAVDNIAAGRTDKSNIWAVNTESDYHETK